MDYDKLIERLRKEAYGSDIEDLLLGASAAIETMRAENAEMEKQLNEFSEFLCYMTGGLLSKTNYTAQEMISTAEDYQQNVCGECDLRAENEKLRAELNDMKAKWDKYQPREHWETLNELCKNLHDELEQVKRENDALWIYIEIVDREYKRYMDRGYIDRLDELKRTWRRGQKED